jgi:hypothetical protein
LAVWKIQKEDAFADLDSFKYTHHGWKNLTDGKSNFISNFWTKYLDLVVIENVSCNKYVMYLKNNQNITYLHYCSEEMTNYSKTKEYVAFLCHKLDTMVFALTNC